LIDLNNKQTTHKKKGFAKNFVRYRFENNFVKHQNNYVRRSSWSLEYQNFLLERSII